MVLYETIVICKPGSSRRTINLMKAVGDAILKNGGDRMMAHDIKGKDLFRYSVGRYVQFLYDSHPSVQKTVAQAVKNHAEALTCQTMRMNDLTDEAITFRRTAKMTTPIISESERNVEFLTALKDIKARMSV